MRSAMPVRCLIRGWYISMVNSLMFQPTALDDTACKPLCQRGDTAIRPRRFSWYLADMRVFSALRMHHLPSTTSDTLHNMQNHEYDTVVSKRSPRLLACMHAMQCLFDSSPLGYSSSNTRRETRRYTTTRAVFTKRRVLKTQLLRDRIDVA
jgi:hypothetical protein